MNKPDLSVLSRFRRHQQDQTHSVKLLIERNKRLERAVKDASKIFSTRYRNEDRFKWLKKYGEILDE